MIFIAIFFSSLVESFGSFQRAVSRNIVRSMIQESTLNQHDVHQQQNHRDF
ncbi:hypothetical protein QNN95_08800 [Exiguobacterium acetylicum]|uniref:hypothetical protein n=1 Tax=Exiguobacterium acetylicum TaxID=41170 RepID=UPI0035A6EC46